MDILTDIILPLAGSPWIYLVALALIILDGFFPLFPSEAVVVGLSALAAANGVPAILPLILVSLAGAFLGDSGVYLLGRVLGRGRVEKLPFAPLHRLLAWASQTLATRPAILILTARFIPGARLAVNLTAGALGYSYARFSPVCLLAGAFWSAYNIGIGYVAGQWFQNNPLLGMVLAILAAIAFGWLLDLAVGAFRFRPAKPVEDRPL